MYFYWQPTKDDQWQAQDAGLRERLIEDKKPPFVTVLDIETPITDSMSADEIAKVKYSGPFYIDLDNDDHTLVIEKFKALLAKLEDLAVDLDCVGLFATGGRGFHIEIPMACFMDKPRALPLLPAVYKEMAWIPKLMVETLDLRVYSAKKGRMWRVPNVQRDNGKYKVQITPTEAKSMTPELYVAITSEPRKGWKLEKPSLSVDLAGIWTVAKAKVEEAVKRRKSSPESKKLQQELISSFKGDFPPSLLKVMRGEVQSAVGFNQTAMQIAITAHALGKKREDVLQACEGLLEKHQSDSRRYASRRAREDELLHQYDYMEGNPCYSFSRGAVKSILPESEPGNDLDGLGEEENSVVTKAIEDEYAEFDQLAAGVDILTTGVVVRTAEGARRICDVSFQSPLRQKGLGGEIVAFDVAISVRGSKPHREVIPIDIFQSKTKLSYWCSVRGGTYQGSDAQAIGILRRLQTMARDGDDEYLLSLEGLCLLEDPQRPGNLDLVWVSPEGVLSSKMLEDGTPAVKTTYKYRGVYNAKGVFRSDLHHCPMPGEGDPRLQETIDALLELNSPYVMGAVLGWGVAAFHRQIFHYTHDAFPLLGVYGQAGAGKSTLIEALTHLYTWKRKIVPVQAGSSTPYGIKVQMLSSASLPVVLEEFKPREMTRNKYEMFKGMFRSAYNMQQTVNGGGAEDPKALQQSVLSAPIVYVGEAQETETAIMERTVTVPLSRGEVEKRYKYGTIIRARRGDEIPKLGRAILAASEHIDVDEFREAVEGNISTVWKATNNPTSSTRILTNTAIVLTGMDALEAVLQDLFPGRYTDKLAEMRQCVIDQSKEHAANVMSEAAKVIHSLAYISLNESYEVSPDVALKQGEDYFVGPDGSYVDLRMRTCYVKYVTWCRRRGFIPLFDNEEAFIRGLQHHVSLVDRAPESPVIRAASPGALVFRFNVNRLEQEGVDRFREV